MDTRLLGGISHEEVFENILRMMRFGVYFKTKMALIYARGSEAYNATQENSENMVILVYILIAF